MLFAKVAMIIAMLAAPAAASYEPSNYYADLGIYGTFELEISGDDGTMTWKSDLKNINKLSTTLNITGGISGLNYHLHQSWNLSADYAIGESQCGLANLGNHYDPYFACGPASGNADAVCDALGRPRNATRYACSGSYALGEYNQCEVGDLSGKEGALTVNPDGTAYGSPAKPDPLAARDAEFVAERTSNSPNKWSSILYHSGSPRVLCAKIFPGKLAPKKCEIEFILYDAYQDKELGPLKDQEFKQDVPLSIEARPNSACKETLSARMTLAGPINSERTEIHKPYAVFGDKQKDFLGRNFIPGDYTIKAELYSESPLKGNLVVSASFDFRVVDSYRRLRSRN